MQIMNPLHFIQTSVISDLFDLFTLLTWFEPLLPSYLSSGDLLTEKI